MAVPLKYHRCASLFLFDGKINHRPSTSSIVQLDEMAPFVGLAWKPQNVSGADGRGYIVGLNGLPKDAGVLKRIQRGLREVHASTMIVAT